MRNFLRYIYSLMFASPTSTPTGVNMEPTAALPNSTTKKVGTIVSDGFQREFIHRGLQTARACVIWLHHGGGNGSNQMNLIKQRNNIVDVCPTALRMSNNETAWIKPDPGYTPPPGFHQQWPTGANGDEDQIFVGEDLIRKIKQLYPNIRNFYLCGHSSGCTFIFSMMHNGWRNGILPFRSYFGVKHLPLLEFVDSRGEFILNHTLPFGWWFAPLDPIAGDPRQNVSWQDTKIALESAYNIITTTKRTDVLPKYNLDVYNYNVPSLRIHIEHNPSHGFASADSYAVKFWSEVADLGS